MSHSCGMEILQAYEQLGPRGVELVDAVMKSKETVHALSRRIHLSQQRISLIKEIGKLVSRELLKAAGEYGYSVDKLHEIASIGHRLKNPDVNVDEVRAAMITQCAQMSIAETKAHIRAEIKRLNGEYKPVREWYLRYSASADHDGMKYLIAKMPAPIMDRLINSLVPQAKQMVAKQMARTPQEGLIKALLTRAIPTARPQATDTVDYEYVGEHENPNNTLDMRQRACFLIPLGDVHMLQTGQIATSDGSLLNVEDVLDQQMEPYGFAVTMYNDKFGVKRPMNVYDLERRANPNQRFLEILSYLVCQHAECEESAVRCDIHHIVAFSQGGKTELENLCPLCHQHNLENDDDPKRPRHGRVIRDPDTGLVWYQLPNGTIRRKIPNPLEAFTGMAVAQRAKAVI